MRLKECDLTTLESRILGVGQIEVLKILNGYENIDINVLSRLKKARKQKQCILDIRTFSFSPKNCCFDMLKNKIETYVRRAVYI